MSDRGEEQQGARDDSEERRAPASAKRRLDLAFGDDFPGTREQQQQQHDQRQRPQSPLRYQPGCELDGTSHVLSDCGVDGQHNASALSIEPIPDGRAQLGSAGGTAQSTDLICYGMVI